MFDPTLNGLSVETTGWEPALLTCFKRQSPCLSSCPFHRLLLHRCKPGTGAGVEKLVTNRGVITEGSLRNFFLAAG